MTRQDINEFLNKPEFSNVSTTDRRFLVGGVRDVISDLVRLMVDDDVRLYEAPARSLVRKANEAFEDMMAQDDQRTLREIREAREKTQAIMGGLN